MATWQEIGIDNFRAAVTLYDGGFSRSATRRLYDAAFSVLTHVDRQGCHDSCQAAEKMFNYLEVATCLGARHDGGYDGMLSSRRTRKTAVCESTGI